jgi:hypothetical protein
MLKKPLLLILLIGCIPTSYSQENLSKIIKVALRDSGNKLLLYNNDSTTLILPIIKLDKNKYELSFEKELSIVPDSLVNTFTNSLEHARLSKNYVVEVINCISKEVVYSYQIKRNEEESIIPCLGRNLPPNCYKIQVTFIEKKTNIILCIGSIILLLVLISLALFLRKNKKTSTNNSVKHTDYLIFGTYKFYENQNKLVRNNLEFKLTLKESQILKIFIQNQNVIVKREQLIKEVWEDNGVVVGRSLDAFISKIRKRFENDNSINIVNIHGVGYKLEVID